MLHSEGMADLHNTFHSMKSLYSIPPCKRWGPVAELTRHLQGSTPSGIRFSHKNYRPSPTKDVTYKDPPLLRGPLIMGYIVSLLFPAGG
jgi:hypothetical protein